MGPGHESREDIDRLLSRFIRAKLAGRWVSQASRLEQASASCVSVTGSVVYKSLSCIETSFSVRRPMDDLRVIPH